MWDLFISDHRVIHILCVSVQGVIIVLQVFLSRGSIWSSWGSLASAQKFILIFYHCLGRHYYFNFCPGGHYNLIKSTSIHWFCATSWSEDNKDDQKNQPFWTLRKNTTLYSLHNNFMWLFFCVQTWKRHADIPEKAWDYILTYCALIV